MSRVLNLQRPAIEQLLDGAKLDEVRTVSGITPKTTLMIHNKRLHHLGVSLPVRSSMNRTKVLIVSDKPSPAEVNPQDYDGPLAIMFLRDATTEEIASRHFYCRSETLELLFPFDFEQGTVTLAYTLNRHSYPRLVGG